MDGVGPNLHKAYFSFFLLHEKISLKYPDYEIEKQRTKT